ncbi:PAS domain-containing protein [Bifidobacterium sp. ESL0784]|uniref:helix-turn-helix transcriptional regulator n=1 Tax=Bifidobacterium sp. ESL0784 TaxID=2983231 RepID=UPI0023F625D4|nr:PAS domain-containing protein [Bifidobacterium sp. ESL0784]MDF7641363.1 PAS domain-containing protein [Bifidobacterium sp. ESL0784]
MTLSFEHLEDTFPLANFIADALGEIAEVLIHDVNDPKKSIIFIRNGNLSGRKVGDGVTDQALKLIQTGESNVRDYVSGYKGAAYNQEFRSSTLFIKNSKGELIGLLCINVDITGFKDTLSLLSKLVPDSNLHDMLPAIGHGENLQGNWSETIRRITRDTVAQYGVSPTRMTSDERINIVRDLKNNGVFLMKSAVNVVAPELGCSVSTLYRYLQNVN